MGTQETFCTRAFDGVAHFFPGDKAYASTGRISAEKEDKTGRMPRGVGLLVDRIELPGSPQTVEMF